MARLRIRIQMFKGRDAVPLPRFGVLSNELHKFLRSLGDDLGIPDAENVWLASHFRDGSISFGAAQRADLSSDLERRGTALGEAITSADISVAQSLGGSDRTLLNFAGLAKVCTDDEYIKFGFYKSQKAKNPTRWVKAHQVTGQKIAEVIHPYIDYHGSVFGVVHSLFKEGDRPHFFLRDLGRGALVKCYYSTSHYTDVVKALWVRDGRLNVSGMIRASRMEREIESLRVEHLQPAEPMTDQDFERFMGCAPGLTGDLTTAEFIERLRDEGG